MILQLNVCRKRCSNITHNNRYKCLEDNSEIFTIDVNLCEIIGKPPTLVDVLKWMFSLKNKDFDFNLHSHSTELRIGENNPFGYDFAWNLNSIYLRDQDEALINFLNDL